MKNFYNTKLFLLLCLVLSFGVITSCDDDDDVDPSGGQVQLLSFGPTGVQHGEEIRFIGYNLNQVESIEFEGATVTKADFLEHTSELIRLVVPQETMEGIVTLKLSKGDDVVSKTELSFEVPITITAVTAEARPGANITITGTKLNWVEGVVFERDTVDEFVSQTATELVLQVPATAKTGKLLVIGGGTEPAFVETETELIVTLPTVTALAPTALKTGEDLIITGANLDLVKEIKFTGVTEAKAAEFVSQTATEIVVTVPANAATGALTLIADSDVEVVTTQQLTVVLPAVSDLSPSAVKHGENLTITGTNLDFVKEIKFKGVGEAKATEFVKQTATELVVKVPDNASTGTLTLVAKSGVEVATTQEMNIVLPAISSLSPSPIDPGQDLTINGTNLDLVKIIKFQGGAEVTSFVSKTANRIVVKVPMNAKKGALTLTTIKNYVVETAAEVTIILPIITSVTPESVVIGNYLTISGTELNQVKSVVFNGGATVSTFVAQNDNQIVLTVPAAAKTGVLKLITHSNFEVTTEKQAKIGVAELEPLPYVLYADARGTGWDDWGWGGASEWGITDQVRQGAAAAKKTYTGDDAIRMHNGTAVSTSGYKSLTFSAYGGPGTDGKTMKVVINEGWNTPYEFPIVEGEWTTYTIPFSELGNPATINDVLFQSAGWAGVVHYDHIGFR